MRPTTKERGFSRLWGAGAFEAVLFSNVLSLFIRCAILLRRLASFKRAYPRANEAKTQFI